MYEVNSKDIINLEIIKLDALTLIKNILKKFSDCLITEEDVKSKISKLIIQSININNLINIKIECSSSKGEIIEVLMNDFYSKIYKYNTKQINKYINAKTKLLVERLINIKNNKINLFLLKNKSLYYDLIKSSKFIGKNSDKKAVISQNNLLENNSFDFNSNKVINTKKYSPDILSSLVKEKKDLNKNKFNSSKNIINNKNSSNYETITSMKFAPFSNTYQLNNFKSINNKANDLNDKISHINSNYFKHYKENNAGTSNINNSLLIRNLNQFQNNNTINNSKYSILKKSILNDSKRYLKSTITSNFSTFKVSDNKYAINSSDSYLMTERQKYISNSPKNVNKLSNNSNINLIKNKINSNVLNLKLNINKNKNKNYFNSCNKLIVEDKLIDKSHNNMKESCNLTHENNMYANNCINKSTNNKNIYNGLLYNNINLSKFSSYCQKEKSERDSNKQNLKIKLKKTMKNIKDYQMNRLSPRLFNNS